VALTLVPLTPAGPILEELLLPDAKALLRIDSTAEDALLVPFLGAARSYVEGRDGIANRALLTQTWDWSLDGFPCAGLLRVPLPPLQSVTSITVRGPDEVPVLWPATAYQVDRADGLLPGRILPVYGGTWPLTGYSLSPITIRFVAGYGVTLDTVPQPLRLALLGLVAAFYTNRDVDAPPPRWVDAMLAPYRLLAA
jgi:uncharacterized phiE125 gp8 family phage protein